MHLPNVTPPFGCSFLFFKLSGKSFKTDSSCKINVSKEHWEIWVCLVKGRLNLRHINAALHLLLVNLSHRFYKIWSQKPEYSIDTTLALLTIKKKTSTLLWMICSMMLTLQQTESWFLRSTSKHSLQQKKQLHCFHTKQVSSSLITNRIATHRDQHQQLITHHLNFPLNER